MVPGFGPPSLVWQTFAHAAKGHGSSKTLQCPAGASSASAARTGTAQHNRAARCLILLLVALLHAVLKLAARAAAGAGEKCHPCSATQGEHSKPTVQPGLAGVLASAVPARPAMTRARSRPCTQARCSQGHQGFRVCALPARPAMACARSRPCTRARCSRIPAAHRRPQTAGLPQSRARPAATQAPSAPPGSGPPRAPDRRP